MSSTLVIVLVLAVILIVPLVCQKIHLPSIIGLILTGMALGPYGLQWLERGDTFGLLAQIGMLYVLFITGIEVDIQGFKDDRRRSLLFGVYTFVIPAIIGLVAARWLLDLSWLSSVLLASLFASHTLMTFPVVSRYGIQNNRTINLVVGGTLFAETLALLILAAISAGTHETIDTSTILRIGLGSLLFVGIVVIAMPRLTGWFFKRFGNPTEEFIWVLLMAMLAGVLAEWAGLEPLLGVFLAGVSLNRLIPNLSPLMNRINFVGNSIFIPIFLLSVGMLIDLHVFTRGWYVLWVALVMCIIAVGGKWLAAWAAQKTFHLLPDQRRLLFGLTTARAAGALAIVMIGYQIIMPNGTRLFSDTLLNATIILILVSCTIAGFMTEQSARAIALSDSSIGQTQSKPMHMLMPVGNPKTSLGLMELALLTLARNRESSIHALSIIRHPEDRKPAEKTLDELAKTGAAVDRAIDTHVQVAANIANGILSVAESNNITQLLLGIQTDEVNRKNRNLTYGDVVNQLLATCSMPVTLYHPVQPLNTIRRIRVAVPRNAEHEQYMLDWVDTLQRLAQQLSVQVVFYANPETIPSLRMLSARPDRKIQAAYQEMQDWEDLLFMAKEVEQDDLIFIVSARRATVSYNRLFETTPYMLNRFFYKQNYMVVYPRQEVNQEQHNTFLADTSISGESNLSLLTRMQNQYYNLKRRFQTRS